MQSNVAFRDLVGYAIGGGWGDESPFADSIKVRIIRGTDFGRIASGDYSSIPVRYESATKCQKRMLEPNDILMEISGGSQPSGQSTGRTMLATESVLQRIGPVIPASFCRLLRIDKARADQRYCYYALQDMYKSGRAALYEHHSTGISNFQFELFLDTERVFLPSMEDQRAIAHILGALDDKIELNRRMNETLEAMARALFKSWFVDFDPVRAKATGRDPGLPADIVALFPDSFQDSELGEIPNGWRVTSLQDALAECETGSRPAGGVSQYSAGVPSVGAESIVGLGAFDYSKTKYVPRSFFDSMTKGHVRSRDVLLYKDGGRPGEFEPHVTLFGDGFPFSEYAINEHVYRMRVSDELGQILLYFWLSSDLVMEEMRIKGTGVAIPGLNSTQAKSLPMLVPTRGIARAFDALAEPCIARLLVGCTESRSLALLRDTLLPKLLSGELRVKDSRRFEEAPS